MQVLLNSSVSPATALVTYPSDGTKVADSCSGMVTISGSLQSSFLLGETGTFIFSVTGIIPGEPYKLYYRRQQGNYWTMKLLSEQIADASGTVQYSATDEELFTETPKGMMHELIINGEFRANKSSCVAHKFSVAAKGNCEITSLEQTRDGVACFYSNVSSQNSCIEPKNDTTSEKMKIHVKNVRKGNQLYINDKVTVRIDGWGDDEVGTTDGAGSTTTEHRVPNTGNYTIKVYEGNGWTINAQLMCQKSFASSADCGSRCLKDEPEASPRSDDVVGAMFELCVQIPDKDLQEECNKCASDGKGGDENQAGVWTAIGCIKRDPTSIMQRFISLGLGIGGGVSLIMTLAGGFILTTSQGDPKRTGQAKEMITNAVIGLIFVIFSVTILQFIGFTVFKLPGFGE